MKITKFLKTFYVLDASNQLLATLKECDESLKIISSSLTVSELEEIFKNSGYNFQIAA